MTSTTYSRTAKLLHWAIALMLAFQLSLGWRLEDLDKGAAQFWGFQLHKSVGITILVLTLIRLVIRWVHPRPALPDDAGWAKAAAKTVHFLLYVVMLGGPLTGWALVSTGKVKFQTLLFGVIPWPHLPLPNSVHEPAHGLHGLLGLLGVLLFVLHVAGALRHQFVKDENLLGRMLPGLGGASIGKGKAALGALIAVGAVLGMMAWAKMMPAPANPPAPTLPAAPPQPGFTDIPPAPEVDTNSVATNAVDAVPVEDASANATAPAEAKPALADWQVAKGGRLGFTSAWTGTPVQGIFGRWDAGIRFNPDMLAQSSIRVSIDLASVNTSDSQRDDMLQSDTFFNTAVHPKAVFTSTKITHQGGDAYRAVGSLTMNGKAQPVALAFVLTIKGDVARVSGSTSLNRLQFGVGTGDYAATDQIPDAVNVSFAFTAKAAPV